ncbi:hypothetical protein V5740_01395 [Croceibacterium sp. TMG7-5b_MA50]|uniref:hypothetical protein n=1 Tax=Croceibacterium sp. TMG7-5b_MA50 TaxID=3121290 RepID=UPI0032218E33
MDLNQLYFDHQRLLITASNPALQMGRDEKEAGVFKVARQIGIIQRTLGASAASSWEALAVTDFSRLNQQDCR